MDRVITAVILTCVVSLLPAGLTAATLPHHDNRDQATIRGPVLGQASRKTMCSRRRAAPYTLAPAGGGR